MHNLVETIKFSPPIDTSTPYDPSSLAGKTILITGGANGLGAAFARHWASHGANLVIGDIDDAGGATLMAELREKSAKRGQHHFAHCDVTVWEDQVALFETASRVSPHGGIDVVVANAGYLHPESASCFENPVADPKGTVDAPQKPSTQVLEINTTGVAYTAHLAMFWLPRNGDGKNPNLSANNPLVRATSSEQRDRCLLLIGSIAGILPLPGQAQYCMSKHAVTGLFRALRGTAWRHGIRVAMLCPYFVGGSNMLPAQVEALLLAGSAGPASLVDTVDAATRLVADEMIVGRALSVGPRVSVGDGPDGVAFEDKEQGKVAVWECFAEDYERVEVFVWRYVRLLNAVELAKGWTGWVWDLLRILLRR